MYDIFAEINRRTDQLYEELAACAVQELTGVVSTSGIAAARFDGRKLWSLSFTFDVWRAGSGKIRTESLTVQRRVTDAELKSFKAVIDSETVIRVQARVAENNVNGSPHAQLEEFIEVDSTDSELHEHLARLQEPIKHRDERLGDFAFDRKYSLYSAEVKWNGESVTLTLNVENHDKIQPALNVAHALWDDESAWQKRIEDFAVKELLPLKNENWLDEEEGELDVTPDEFKAKMTLDSISVYADGEFEFWHNDGDLFFGHTIQISGNLAAGLTRADIPG